MLCFQTDISDVNTIFKDLSVLVHEQGETLGVLSMIVLVQCDTVVV